MYTRLLIVSIISSVLVAGIYSSSSVFAAKDKGIVTSCTAISSTTTDCLTYDTKYGDTQKYRCTTSDGGKTWQCNRISAAGKEAMPPQLDSALDAAIGESQNTTEVPKGSFLNDGGFLKGQDDNQSTSKTIVGPNDRFCVEGTGGDTGSPCLPCDPGLKFEVGCIDVTTGGPLDMPDAATSEEEQDTNPKDLDGSNNDDNGPEVNPGSD